jgi:hypothetical protein
MRLPSIVLQRRLEIEELALKRDRGADSGRRLAAALAKDLLQIKIPCDQLFVAHSHRSARYAVTCRQGASASSSGPGRLAGGAGDSADPRLSNPSKVRA